MKMEDQIKKSFTSWGTNAFFLFFFKAFVRERSAFGANVCTYVTQRGGQFATRNREADSNWKFGVQWAGLKPFWDRRGKDRCNTDTQVPPWGRIPTRRLLLPGSLFLVMEGADATEDLTAWRERGLGRRPSLHSLPLTRLLGPDPGFAPEPNPLPEPSTHYCVRLGALSTTGAAHVQSEEEDVLTPQRKRRVCRRAGQRAKAVRARHALGLPRAWTARTQNLVLASDRSPPNVGKRVTLLTFQSPEERVFPLPLRQEVAAYSASDQLPWAVGIPPRGPGLPAGLSAAHLWKHR